MRHEFDMICRVHQQALEAMAPTEAMAPAARRATAPTGTRTITTRRPVGGCRGPKGRINKYNNDNQIHKHTYINI